jgi:diacylglycerol kinase
MSFVTKIFHSFKHAFTGVGQVFLNELNFRVHTLAALLVLFLGFYFNIAIWQWVVVIFLILLIFILEILNTVFERLVDMLKPRLHIYAGEIKNLMSAMVLIAAISAIIIGYLIFAPYLKQAFFS